MTDGQKIKKELDCQAVNQTQNVGKNATAYQIAQVQILKQESNSVNLNLKRQDLFDKAKEWLNRAMNSQGRFFHFKDEKNYMPFAHLQGIPENLGGNNHFISPTIGELDLSVDGEQSLKEVLEELRQNFSEKPERNVVLIAAGGMGKTFGLLNYASECLGGDKSSKESDVIPFFIPLNDFRNEKERNPILFFLFSLFLGEEHWNFSKTSFLEEIKKQRICLLLDGLNEVTNPQIRQNLLNEIEEISRDYQNIQIVIASRRDIGYYTASNFRFQRKMLKPLSLNAIENYLKQVLRTEILPDECKRMLKNPVTLELLSSPLCLKMYSFIVQKERTEPSLFGGQFRYINNMESTGELIWNYFTVTRADISDSFKKEDDLVLNYILPCIGSYMESKGKFQIDSGEMDRYFKRAIKFLSQNLHDGELLDCCKKITFAEFMEIESTYSLLLPFAQNDGQDDKCYSWYHQCFRDYCAARYIYNCILESNYWFEIQKESNDLIVLQKAREILCQLFQKSIHQNVLQFLGEICQEHKAAPRYNTSNQQWENMRETALENCLDILRLQQEEEFPEDSSWAIPTKNIIEVIKNIRKDLSGFNFNRLDLSLTSLNGVYCSRGDLVSTFVGSRIRDYTLFPKGHGAAIFSMAVYDENTIFTFSKDSIWRYDAQQQESFLVFDYPYNAAILTAVISKNKEYLFTGDSEGNIIIWGIDSALGIRKIVEKRFDSPIKSIVSLEHCLIIALKNGIVNVLRWKSESYSGKIEITEIKEKSAVKGPTSVRLKQHRIEYVDCLFLFRHRTIYYLEQKEWRLKQWRILWQVPNEIEGYIYDAEFICEYIVIINIRGIRGSRLIYLNINDLDANKNLKYTIFKSVEHSSRDRGYNDIIVSPYSEKNSFVVCRNSTDSSLQSIYLFHKEGDKIIEDPSQFLSNHSLQTETARYFGNPDNPFLASISVDRSMKVYSLDHNWLEYSFNGFYNSVRAVCARGNRLFIASYDGTVREWRWTRNFFSANEWICVQTVGKHNGWIWGLDIFETQDKRTLVASSSYDRTVCLWNGDTSEKILQIPFQSRVNSICFSPDGEYLLATCGRFIVQSNISNHGRKIIVGEQPGEIKCAIYYQMEDCELNEKYKLILSGNTASDHGNGQYYAEMCIWDAQKEHGLPLHSFRLNEGFFRSIRLNPKQNLAFTAGAIYKDQFATAVWKIPTWAAIQEKQSDDLSPPYAYLVGHTKEVVYATPIPGYEFFVATASSDKSVNIYDCRNLQQNDVCEPVITLQHDDQVFNISFSTENMFVASLSGNVYVWNLENILRKTEHAAGFNSVIKEEALLSNIAGYMFYRCDFSTVNGEITPSRKEKARHYKSAFKP